MEAPCFLRSLWHGPTRDGVIEVVALGVPPRGMIRSQPVVALRGPNAGDILSQLAVLAGLAPSSPPILQALTLSLTLFLTLTLPLALALTLTLTLTLALTRTRILTLTQTPTLTPTQTPNPKP